MKKKLYLFIGFALLVIIVVFIILLRVESDNNEQVDISKVDEETDYENLDDSDLLDEIDEDEVNEEIKKLTGSKIESEDKEYNKIVVTNEESQKKSDEQIVKEYTSKLSEEEKKGDGDNRDTETINDINEDNYIYILMLVITNNLDDEVKKSLNEDFKSNYANIINEIHFMQLRGVTSFQSMSSDWNNKTIALKYNDEVYHFKFKLDKEKKLKSVEYIEK